MSTSRTNSFQHRTLALFLIVSLLPAVTVSIIWYVLTRNGAAPSDIVAGNLLIPLAALAIIPALILSILFAELLTVPVRKLYLAIFAMANGNLDVRPQIGDHAEFAEMAKLLNQISDTLERVLSEAQGETEQIASERNQLRGVLDNMTDGVFALDRDNHIILFNQAAGELTGRSFQEVAGRPADSMIPLRLDGQLVVTDWLTHHRDVVNQQDQRWHNLELVRAVGTSLNVDVQAIRLPSDPNGIQALVTFHDITKSQQLEEMKFDFVAMAAHELRTPLTAIRGYLDLISNEGKDKLPESSRTFLERCSNAAEQLAELVNKLLSVSRIEHNELNLNLDLISATEYFTNIAKVASERMIKVERRFAANIATRLPKLFLDTTAVEEVVTNLVNNAAQHTEVGGHITLSVTKAGSRLHVTVTDDGTGIPKDKIDKLFSKFYRAEGLHSHRGTGLGLFISKSIVEAHGGYIWVESEEGHGATFGFELPLEHPVAPQPETSNTMGIIRRGSHGWIKDHSVH